MDWEKYIDRTLNVTMNENYGVVYGEKKEHPNFYEIVFKTGKLREVFEDGLLIESVREKGLVLVFIPYSSIKCVEIF
jgi:archaeosine-15-forming tRNA-guanine transglycosylase